MEAEVWQNREEGGRALAGALGGWRSKRPLVLAIPRGAVPMGAVIADAIGADLDLMLVHKIGHPMQPEVAIGAVDEHGHVVTAGAIAPYGTSRAVLDELGRREVGRLKERRHLYGGEPARVSGRTVILVDDGIATGATMLAAVRAARAGGAAEIVVASPVASPEAFASLREEADSVVVLDMPRNFYAVGQFYRDFRQVEDDEVRALLEERRLEPV